MRHFMSGENAPKFRRLVLYQSSVLRWQQQKDTISEIFIFIADLKRL